MYTPVNPSFTIYMLKWDIRGQNYIGMFSWCAIITSTTTIYYHNNNYYFYYY